MKTELQAWLDARAYQPDESGTEHDLRVAFAAARFLDKHAQSILHPWRGFLTPEERAASQGQPVLVKNARGEVSIMILGDDNGHGIFAWMPIRNDALAGADVDVRDSMRAALVAALTCRVESCTCPSGDGSLRWPCPAHPAEQAEARGEGAFQSRVAPWMQECFGPEVSADRVERADRFLEEALELAQSGGYDKGRVAALVEYVWNRPAGEPPQEVGGVMVTLAAYCLAHGLDMHEAGEVELARILQPETVQKIRAKQAAKAREIPFSPLPATPIGVSAEQGMVMVPREPTLEMVLAYNTGGGRLAERNLSLEGYRAMLAASAPPMVGGK